MSRLRRLLGHIGGPYALDGRVIGAYFLLFMVVTLVLDVPAGADRRWSWLVAGVASVLTGVGFLLLARRFLLPPTSRPARPATALTVYAAAGAVRVSVLWWVGSALGISVDPARGGSAMVVCAVVMSLAALTVQSEASHRRERERLVLEQHRLLALRASFGERVAQSERDLQRQIHEELDPALSRIDAALTAEDDDRRASLIIDAVGRIVRPMSHRLVTTDGPPPVVALDGEPPPAAPSAHPIDVRRSMLPGTVAVITASLSLGYLVSGTEWTWASVPRVAIVTLAGYATVVALRRWWPRRLRYLGTGPAVAALGTYYAAGGMVSSAVLALLGPLLFGESWATGSAPMSHNTTWPLTAPLVVGLGLSSLVIAEQRLQQAEADLREVNDELDVVVSRLRAQLWVNRQQLSWVLHGPVQSALLAAAHELQNRNVDADDRERIRVRIAEAAAHLETGQIPHHALGRAMDELCRLWEYTCPLRISAGTDVRERLDGDPTASYAVIEILREGVSNAVRHGGATQVNIELALSERGLVEVRLTDNGSGLAPSDSGGLGTSLLNQVCHRWSRTSTPTGCVLEAQVTVA